MKISRLQLVIAIIIVLALVITVIITMGTRPAKPKTIAPEYEAGTEGLKSPQAGRFELPEEEYNREETIKEELIPENVIEKLETAAADQTEFTSKEQPGAEPGEMSPAAQEDPDKFRKKYPTPKQLREIKEQGLIIY